MTFKDLTKFVQQQESLTSEEEQQQQQQYNPKLELLIQRLRDRPFWIANASEHKKEWERTDKFCCFWHQFTPTKYGQPQRCYDYEQNIIDLLENKTHYLAILKAVGLGISTLSLMWIIWRCIRDDCWSGKNVNIVVGPNFDLALRMIKRIRDMFEEHHGIIIESKMSKIIINDVTIEAFPANHLSSFRSLEKPICTYFSEADFFEKSQAMEARQVAERYIPKAGKDHYYILMESTANQPDNMLDTLFREKEDSCLYTRLTLDYLCGLKAGIYTQEDVDQLRKSPAFDREMCCKFSGLIGNVFSTTSIDAAVANGSNYLPPESIDDVNFHTQKSMGLDPAWGSSAFGIVICQRKDKFIEVLEAMQFERPDFNQLLKVVFELLHKYGRSIGKIYIDGANPSFIRALKLQIGENENYEEDMKYYAKKGMDYETSDDVVIPVNFAQEHREMLGNCKLFLEREYIAINPKFDKLITSLRTAVENDGKLDKQATSYNDIFDAFRLSLKNWYLRSKEDAERKYAYVQSFEMERRFS
jgi:hypothetical protein